VEVLVVVLLVRPSCCGLITFPDEVQCVLRPLLLIRSKLDYWDTKCSACVRVPQHYFLHDSVLSFVVKIYCVWRSRSAVVCFKSSPVGSSFEKMKKTELETLFHSFISLDAGPEALLFHTWWPKDSQA